MIPNQWYSNTSTGEERKAAADAQPVRRRFDCLTPFAVRTPKGGITPMPPFLKARFRFMIELTNAHAAQRDDFPGSASCDMVLSAVAAVSCGGWAGRRRGCRHSEAFYLTAELCHHVDLRLVLDL